MKKKSIVISLIFIVIFCFSGIFIYCYLTDYERYFKGNHLLGWTDGQRACGSIRKKSPKFRKQLLDHPNIQIQFAAACIILNCSRTPYYPNRTPQFFSPKNGYSDNDIDKSMQALKEGFLVKDKSSAGLRRYIAEHLSHIYDKRLIEILVIALEDEDVAHGSSSIGVECTLRDLTNRGNFTNWKQWYKENYEHLEWNGKYFENKKEPFVMAKVSLPNGNILDSYDGRYTLQIKGKARIGSSIKFDVSGFKLYQSMVRDGKLKFIIGLTGMISEPVVVSFDNKGNPTPNSFVFQMRSTK